MNNSGIFKASFREISDLSIYLAHNLLYSSSDREINLTLTSDSCDESFIIRNDLELFELLRKHNFKTLIAGVNWSALIKEFYVITVPIADCDDHVVYGDYNYDVFLSV